MKSWRSSSERLKAAKRSAREDDMLSPIVEYQHTVSLFKSSVTEDVGTNNGDSDKDDLWVTGVCILTVSRRSLIAIKSRFPGFQQFSSNHAAAHQSSLNQQ